MQYEVSGRRAPFVVVGLLLLLIAYGGAITLVLMSDMASDAVMDAVLAASGGVILGMIVLVLYSLRKFAWTIHARELEVMERGRIFSFAPNRHARIAFASLKALRRIEAGQEVIAEAETDTGRRFHLPSKMTPRPGSIIPAADEEGHRQFLDALLAAIASSGLRPPRLTQGLGFWQRPYGIAVIFVLVLLSLALALAMLWALADGMSLTGAAMKGGGIVLAMPAGAAWLLWRAIKRRRTVLKAMAAGQG